MTTPIPDLCEKLEELAKWHDEAAYHDFIAGGVAAGEHHDRAALIRKAISLLRREGMVWVPKEPTESMVSAADLFFINESFVSVSPAQRKAIYKAMLKAAKEDK